MENDQNALGADAAAVENTEQIRPTETASDSIDGVEYRVEVINGQAFIEPRHDLIVQSTTFANRILYFSETAAYSLPVTVSENVSEAGGSVPSAALKSSV